MAFKKNTKQIYVVRNNKKTVPKSNYTHNNDKQINKLIQIEKPKRKTRAQYWQEYLDSKKNPDKKKYYAFFSKSRNNLFITITNVRGEVITSKSAGDCKIKTKKKKRSWDTLKEMAEFTAKVARLKNIKYIYKFFTDNSYIKNSKIIFKGFKSRGVIILKTVLVRSKPFSLPMRKKKARRL